MVSKEPSRCQLTSTENEAEQAASRTLEMKYALDPNRQIRKRNKALQVRFKDIREAQNEQEKRLSAAQQLDKKTMKAISYKAAYRKYMTVPARRSIPNVTRSTGVQTSPDLKKRYQTFPLERKKVNVIKIAPTVDTFRRQNNDWAVDIKDSDLNKNSGERTISSADRRNQKNPDISSHNNFIKVNKQAGSDSFDDPSSKDPEIHSYTEEPSHVLKLTDSNPTEQNYQLCNMAKYDKVPSENQNLNQSVLSELQLTEFTSFHLTEANCELTQPDSSNSFTQDSPQNTTTQEVHERTLHPTSLHSLPVNGQACSVQSPQSEEPSESSVSKISPSDESQSQSNQTAVSVMESNQQIMPLTEVMDLKAQLQIMENLISSSQETIKVLLGVIQELEKGEALREGLSYRTGQDTANCDTCRNSACIIYSVELDFKQQEDKFQPVMRKLHPTEETQVSTLPYSQEFCSSAYQKQKPSKTESKKHGKWKLWFL
ncbi:inhibitory synaptic factor 2A isoform X2 [Carcharodon carcharias]|uniref:inhibitory synaptic factor 2A isoform X2 n=1 Tax=Carcharodon carcharias TaxID=13397 RepID=UPI001B7DA678|nr:inhibitory synaptic factor 2A isoform X2 [Carcharodon carcharias]